MGQTDSKLGTGLKSTGGSFRRESVQAHPVLVYTNLLTGPPGSNVLVEIEKWVRLGRNLREGMEVKLYVWKNLLEA